jgi:HlyD family secretion protein
MPAIQDNVVSYTVIINVDNQDGSLLPGMTCAVEFIEEQREDVLLVPNAALRYQPGDLAADEIAERVFQAGLRGMDEDQRAAALEARERARSETPAAQTVSRPAQNTGLTGMMMPQRGFGARGQRPGGNGPGTEARLPGQAMTPPKPLWFMDGNGRLDCFLAQSGISDGSFTEIRVRNEEVEGRQIIVRERPVQ